MGPRRGWHGMVQALAYSLIPFIALWAALYTVNEPPARRLQPALSRLARAVGLATLISFTSVTVALALIAGEAVVFYHEPSPIAWAAEVFLGVYGVIVGLRELLGLR